MDPIPPRDRRDLRPHRLRLRGGSGESFSYIWRQLWFRFFRGRRDLETYKVALLCACSLTQLSAYFQPVTLLAVWLKHGLEREAIDRALDRSHSTRGEFRTRVLWQDEKAP